MTADERCAALAKSAFAQDLVIARTLAACEPSRAGRNNDSLATIGHFNLVAVVCLIRCARFLADRPAGQVNGQVWKPNRLKAGQKPHEPPIGTGEQLLQASGLAETRESERARARKCPAAWERRAHAARLVVSRGPSRLIDWRLS